jgi:hypothetical protein
MIIKLNAALKFIIFTKNWFLYLKKIINFKQVTNEIS